MRQHVLRAVLLGGVAVLSSAGWQTASAQCCPDVYGYASGYGCVPGGAGYGAYYGSPGYDALPPVYEPFGFAYGGYGGYRRGGFAREGFPQGGFPGNFRGFAGFHRGIFPDRGGFRGGIFRGGGFHGGRFHGGGGFHGGGHR